MERCSIILSLLLVMTSSSVAQELPKPTPAGEKALNELIDRLVAVRALERIKDAKSGALTLVFGDGEDVKSVVEKVRATLNPELLDALIARSGNADRDYFALSYLLKVAAEFSENRRAKAFQRFFVVRRSGTNDNSLEEAARGFRACEERLWEAECYFLLGTSLSGKKSYTKAMEAHQKAMEIRLAILGNQHTRVADSYDGMATVYLKQGWHARALEAGHKALAIRRAALGDKHLDVANSYLNIAKIYSEQGEHARALEVSLKALEIRRAILGDRHLDVAEAYSGIAGIYTTTREQGRALEAYLRALDIRRAALGERDRTLVFDYLRIGSVRQASHDLTRALEDFTKASELARAGWGEKDTIVALCNDHFAAVYRAQGYFTRALDLDLESLKIRLAAKGESDSSIAYGYENVADGYMRLDDLTRALEAYTKALEIRRIVSGDRDLDVCRTYSSISSVYWRQGDFKRALEASSKTLEIRRAILGDRHRDVASDYAFIAQIYESQGEHARALEAHHKVLETRRTLLGDRHPDVAESYADIAGIYSAQGDHPRSLDVHLIALRIRLAALGDKSQEVARSYDRLAFEYAQMGDYARAVEANIKALNILRAIWGDQNPLVGYSYLDLAYTYVLQSNEQRALEANLKALDILRATLGDRHLRIAYVYDSIALGYSHQGDEPKALEARYKALDIYRAIRGDRHLDVANCYIKISLTYRSPSDRTKAFEAVDRAREALGLTRETGEVGDPKREVLPLNSLRTAVEILMRSGQLHELSIDPSSTASLNTALVDYRAAADALDLLREDTARDEDKVRAAEKISELFPRAIGVSARLAASSENAAPLKEAFSFAERGAARVFLEGLGRSHASSSGRVDPATLDNEARLNAKIRELDGQLTREQDKPFEKRDELAVERLSLDRKRAEEDWRAHLSRMERDFPQYAALKHPRSCTIPEARACLADDEVGLTYILGDGASYLLVLSPRADAEFGGIAVHKLPPADRLAEIVAALTQAKALEDSDATRERGEAAYKMLLAPAANAIVGKRLVIVPGGVLSQIPFELLAEPDGKGGSRFLVQGHSIRYAPSMTALHMIRRWEGERPQAGRSLWALGDPVYSPSDSRMANAGKPSAESIRLAARLGGAERGAAFERLEGTGREVDRLTSLMGSKAEERLMGPNATEVAVKRLSADGTLANYRYIHFACHGVLGTGNGVQPGLVLSQIGNPEGQDGYLRLDEVTDLRLNADLVTLSACQTGQGKVFRAEGVSGLARAFLYAGSRGVLCSLWQVDDEATADLMTDLYINLKAGQPAADALRSAQLKMIETGEPPLHWAPFVLIGR